MGTRDTKYSQYTMTIYQMTKAGFKLSDYEYDFYTDDLEVKRNFEKKFIDHYYFKEIGFDTAGIFIHYLRAKLNKIMPYYKQLYETELAIKDIDFMLNKDLKETFIREVETENNSNGKSTTENKTNSKSDGEQQNNHKESNIANGNANLQLHQDYLTGISNDTSNYSTEDKNEGTSKVNAEQSDNGTIREKTELISQGNIGVTSSAELLRKWRDVLINIDEMIINECEDLFLGVF